MQEPGWGNVKEEAQYLPSSSHWSVPCDDSKSTAFGICWLPSYVTAISLLNLSELQFCQLQNMDSNNHHPIGQRELNNKMHLQPLAKWHRICA